MLPRDSAPGVYAQRSNARLSAFRADALPAWALRGAAARRRDGLSKLTLSGLLSVFHDYILSRGHLGSGETLLTPLYLMLVRAAPPLIPVCVVEGVS